MDSIPQEGTANVKAEAVEQTNTTTTSANDTTVPEAAPPLKLAVRLDSYQTEADFVVSMMAKNLKKEEVLVEFAEQTFRVRAKLSDGTDYVKNIHLANKIRPDNCSYKVMSTKVEIRLCKLEGGMWSALEAKENITKYFKPIYPSSSTKKNDWDKLENEIKKQEQEEPDDGFNSLLAKIYNSGDENSQRAMIKSMQESNGTVLSTNWEEVCKSEVEVSPPDGVEFKKWQE